MKKVVFIALLMLYATSASAYRENWYRYDSGPSWASMMKDGEKILIYRVCLDNGSHYRCTFYASKPIRMSYCLHSGPIKSKTVTIYKAEIKNPIPKHYNVRCQ